MKAKGRPSREVRGSRGSLECILGLTTDAKGFNPTNVSSADLGNDGLSSRMRIIDDDPAGILSGFPYLDDINGNSEAASIKEKIGHILGVPSKKKSKDIGKSPPTIPRVPNLIDEKLGDNLLSYDYDEKCLAQIMPLIPEPSHLHSHSLHPKGNPWRGAVSKFKTLESGICFRLNLAL